MTIFFLNKLSHQNLKNQTRRYSCDMNNHLHCAASTFQIRSSNVNSKFMTGKDKTKVTCMLTAKLLSSVCDTTHSSLQQLNEYKNAVKNGITTLPSVLIWSNSWMKKRLFIASHVSGEEKTSENQKPPLEIRHIPGASGKYHIHRLLWSVVCERAYLFCTTWFFSLHLIIIMSTEHNAICLGMNSAPLNVLHLCWEPFESAAAVFFAVVLKLFRFTFAFTLRYITLSHFRLLIVCYQTENILTQFIY